MNIDMNEFNIEKPQSKLFDIDNLDLNNTPDLKVSVNKMNVNDLNNNIRINSPPRLFEISNIGIDLLENKNRKKSQSFSMDQDLASLDLSKGDIDISFNDGFNLFDQLQKNDNSKDRYLKQKQERSQDNYFKDAAKNINMNLDDNKFKNNLPNLGKETMLDFNIDLSNSLNMENINNVPLQNIDFSLDDLNKQFNNNPDPFQNMSSLDFNLDDNKNANNNAQQQTNREPAPQTQPKKVEVEKDDLDDLNIDELLSECDTLKNKHNIHVPSHFNRNSPVEEVRSFIRRERKKREKNNSEKLGAKILMTTITALEFLNNKFDPFDLKLDGWSESVHENIDDYNDVFGELYEKYKTSAKVPPEIKLMMMVGGSAAMVHLTNTMFKSSLPGMEEMMKQNPDMMKQFAQAAMNQMGQSVPAGMFGQNQGSAASKPEAMSSQNNNQFNSQNNNQDKNQPTHQFNRAPPQYPQVNKMRGPTLNPDMNFTQNLDQRQNTNVVGPRPQPSNQVKMSQPPRREMTGPSGVDDILKELERSAKPPTPKLTSPNGSIISKGTNNRRTINLNI